MSNQIKCIMLTSHFCSLHHKVSSSCLTTPAQTFDSDVLIWTEFSSAPLFAPLIFLKKLRITVQ